MTHRHPGTFCGTCLELFANYYACDDCDNVIHVCAVCNTRIDLCNECIERES